MQEAVKLGGAIEITAGTVTRDRPEMVFGAWCLVPGPFLVPGPSLVPGPRSTWIKDGRHED